ncbi:transglutaminase [Paenibacillus sp. GSMTC-2017]|uniref:transglutaminase domain-containing protein n=1 Tax=Paenibacillus sp. GSMTC-2017 TaxID=2794350 RepID=UPI0018D6FCAD|nr:transglutaminase domain-containing protein [Paenibacillus sp. GSMTC-2017]MBH5319108.1 transglutaminase [Paenibacillus sp. GSMTC-2017]
MRKAVIRLFMLVLIIAGTYSLYTKMDLFPTVKESNARVETEGGDEIVLSKLDSSSKELAPYEDLVLELATGFQSRSDRFSATFTGNKSKLSDNMTAIVRASLKYDDYSAYILDSYLYTIRSWGNRSTITVEARYRESEEETAIVDRKVEEALKKIIQPRMNDHEKVKAIHDWVVTNVQYDQTLTFYTAYDAVALGETVCQGYSLLGYKMLKEAGIPVLIAEGSVNTGEHAWNMVQLDGNWYHLDLTWDDPVGAEDSTIRYTYYLKTDEELRADHQWTRTYPTANKNYLDVLNELETKSDKVDGLLYNKLKLSLGLHWMDSENTITNEKLLRESIQSAVHSRSTLLQFRYTNGTGFPDALKSAFEGIGVAVGYRASYEPFGSDDSLIVNIHLNYE